MKWRTLRLTEIESDKIYELFKKQYTDSICLGRTDVVIGNILKKLTGLTSKELKEKLPIQRF